MKRKKLLNWKRMAAFAMAVTLMCTEGASVGVTAAQVTVNASLAEATEAAEAGKTGETTEATEAVDVESTESTETEATEVTEATETESTEETEATEEEEDLESVDGVSKVIGLEGSSKADETDTDESSNTTVTFSFNYPADHEKEAVFVSDVTKYYDEATGLYLYNGQYYENADKSSKQLYTRVSFITTTKPAIDSKTGVYKVNGDYYADLADEDIDGMWPSRRTSNGTIYYGYEYGKVTLLGQVDANVDVRATYGREAYSGQGVAFYYEYNGKKYAYLAEGKTVGNKKWLYTKTCFGEGSLNKSHHVIQWNKVTNETEQEIDGKTISIGYQVKVNDVMQNLMLEAVDGQTFQTHCGFASHNILSPSEQQKYEVRALYYTESENQKTGNTEYTIVKTGTWSDAYSYAYTSAAVKKTLPQVTGLTATMQSTTDVQLTWNEVPEADEYTIKTMGYKTKLPEGGTWNVDYGYVLEKVKVAEKGEAGYEEYEAARKKYGAMSNVTYYSTYSKVSGTLKETYRNYYVKPDRTTTMSPTGSLSNTYLSYTIPSSYPYMYFFVRAEVNSNRTEYWSTCGKYSEVAGGHRKDEVYTPAIQNMRVEYNTDGTFTLKWDPIENVDYIRIYVAKDESFFQSGFYLEHMANAYRYVSSSTTEKYLSTEEMKAKYKTLGEEWDYKTVDAKLTELNSSDFNGKFEPGETYYFAAAAYDSSKQYTNREETTPYTITKADGTVVKYGYYTNVGTPSQIVSATRTIGKITKPSVKSGKNSITITFKKQQGTGFEIYRKSGKKYKKIATTTSTQYVDQGLKAETTYSYKARAYLYDKETGRTTYSSYVAFSADTSTVCNMTLNAVQKSKNTVKLNWTKVKGAEKYLVYRSNYASGDNSYSKKNGSNTNAKWKLIKTIKKSKTTSYTDKKLTAGETYNYRVVAVYQVKKVTKQIDATASVVLDLQAPQNAVAYASGSQIKISWDTDKFAKQYEVRYTRYNAQGKAYTKRPETAVTKQTSYVINGQAGDYAKIELRASDGSKWTEWTAKDTVKTYLQNVSGVTAKKVTVCDANGVASQKVQIFWNAVPGAAYYKVGRSTTPATSYNKDLKCYDIPEDADAIVKETNTDESSTYSVARYHDYKNQKNTIVATTALDGGVLEQGVTYYYYVAAFSENGKIASYGVAKNVKVAYCDGAGISKITSKGGKTTVSIKKVTGAQKYEVYRSTKKNKGFKKIGTTKSTTYVDKKTKKGKTYYYKVKAVGKNALKADFETGLSSAVKVKVKAK